MAVLSVKNTRLALVWIHYPVAIIIVTTDGGAIAITGPLCRLTSLYVKENLKGNENASGIYGAADVSQFRCNLHGDSYV